MVYWLFVCRIRRLNLFAILRCRWVERHFERAGQFVRDHTAIACHYMSHFAEAAATSRICNSINIVRVRSGLTVFIFFGSNWNGCQWRMVLHLFATFAIFAKLFTTFDRLSVIFEYCWKHMCHWRFYTCLHFATMRRRNTYFCIFWNSIAKHLQFLARKADFINNLLW